MAKFGRAGHAISWATGSRRIRLGRGSRALVFGRESLEIATLGGENLDIANVSRDILVAPPPLWSRRIMVVA